MSVEEKQTAQGEAPGSAEADQAITARRVLSRMRSTTPAQRRAAAAKIRARRIQEAVSSGKLRIDQLGDPGALLPCPGTNWTSTSPPPTPEYFGCHPNWAISPPMRKFVDGLPGVGYANRNNLGQYIPVATKDTARFPGSDYYEIGLFDFRERMHSDLPNTTLLRGYRDMLAPATVGGQPNPDYNVNHYAGPLIIAQKDVPVRIKFTNNLAKSGTTPSGSIVPGSNGDLFVPVDTYYMGAGVGRLGGSYTQNRATVHLHGGNTPWISDGTPHQWVTPAGDPTVYKKGDSFVNVPDMVGPGTGIPNPSAGDGIATHYWTNQQSARLMFYHDHALGITRLNVYVGQAAGYLLWDNWEEDMISGTNVAGQNATLLKNAIPDLGGVYHYGIPLIIQDKSWVPDLNTLAYQDPTWWIAKWGGPGNLWFPHAYMTNQNPNNDEGANPMGRWDYGPWFWPPQTTLEPTPLNPTGLPYFVGNVTNGCPAGWQCPVYPAISGVPESFQDTPVINGAAYPYLALPRGAYRFRILNACNDRHLNLSFFKGDPTPGSFTVTSPTGVWKTEVKMVEACPTSACAGAIDPVTGLPTVGAPADCFPPGWPIDNRDGGVPDPATAGPKIIQIGTEGGFLPAPVDIPAQPINYNYNRRDITVLNVLEHGLFLGPAERADIIVDLSSYNVGDTLIFYNDSPAPVPAADPRLDYFTGAPDQQELGGAATPQPGWGPNTRTMMQVRIVAGTGPAFNRANLDTLLPKTFTASQPPIIVPMKAYGNSVNNYARISNTELTITTPTGTTVKPMLPKAIHELFQTDYGRMNALLGTEVALTSWLNQTTIPLKYIDPPTEIFKDGEVQIWKITHNGVDTHAVHFHLFNLQVLNRIGWDGAIKPPDPNELGWKETVRMNPLEDVVVALQPFKQASLPWGVSDSIRLLDVTHAEGTTGQFTNVNPADNTPRTDYNLMTNFGWEYVWHCHLLGHEENDMMRPMVFLVAPSTPASLLAAFTTTPSNRVNLSWKDAGNETGYVLQRDISSGFGAPTTIPLAANTLTYADTSVVAGNTYYYRINATNAQGTSAWSNVASAVVTVAGPGAPTNVVATWSAGSPTRVIVTFTDNATNETNFSLERAEVIGGVVQAFSPLSTLPARAGSGATVGAVDSTITRTKAYQYRVRANGAGGTFSAWATSATVQTN